MFSFHGSLDCLLKIALIFLKEYSLICHSPDIFHVFFFFFHFGLFFLCHFSHAYVGQDYSIQKNVGKISLEQIDSVSRTDHLFLKCQVQGAMLPGNRWCKRGEMKLMQLLWRPTVRNE